VSKLIIVRNAEAFGLTGENLKKLLNEWINKQHPGIRLSLPTTAIAMMTEITPGIMMTIIMKIIISVITKNEAFCTIYLIKLNKILNC
jgi:hypothetical protein